MTWPSPKRPVNARWIIRNMDRLHWRSKSRYKTMGRNGPGTTWQVVRDRNQAPLLHKGKKP